MKRLLCILSGMNAGGAETFLMKIYRKLDRSKYQMDFCINVREECFYENEILELGGRIFRIPSKSESFSGFKSGLFNIVKDNKYENVLRITSNAMGFMDLGIAKDAGAKVCIARSSNSSDGSGLKAKIAHIIGRILYTKYVDVKIAPSDLAATYTFGQDAMQNNEVIILKNAIDLDLFKYNKEKRVKIRNSFNIRDEKIVVGHIGRFSKQKNHEHLLAVFSKLREQNKDVVLLLVGDGELRNALVEKSKNLGIENSVIFAGIRSDIPDLLSAMDVFVFPSFYEGMPNVVVEAQATGLPCIVADTITRETQITDLVQYISLNDSVENWCNLINRMMLKVRTEENISVFIEKGYSIDDMIKEFIRLSFRDS